MSYRTLFLSVLMYQFTTGICMAGLDGEKTVQNIKNKVHIEQAYQIDENITFTLQKDQSIKLTISNNPYRFSEFYIFWGDFEGVGELVYMLGYDSNQNQLLLTGSKSKRGALRQIGRLPYLSIAEWNKEEQNLHIDFCISSDKQRNSDMINLATELHDSGKESFSTMTKNWAPLAAPELTETEMIAGFVRLWSEVKYNFAFFDQVPEVDWDQVLIDYLPKVQKAENTFEYYRILKQCIALLKDGHTSVSGPSNEPDCNLPIRIRILQGKAIITDVIALQQLDSSVNQQALEKANIEPGDEITHIDGRTIKEILQEDLYPYISASTPQWLNVKASPELLKGPQNSTAVLQITKPDGRQQEISFIRKHYTFKYKPNQFDVQQLDGQILYINLNSFSSEQIVRQFESALPQILESKGLILDVRRNGGGSSGNGADIIRYLIDKPIDNTNWKTPQHIAAYKAWDRKNENWHYGSKRTLQPRADKIFSGPVIVLTSAHTFSAAEDFTVVLHAAKRALIVGERTGGSTGQPQIVDNLPGGGSARICTKWDTYPDGRDFVGVGVIPDVEIYPTPQDIAAGKDTILLEGIRQMKALMEKAG